MSKNISDTKRYRFRVDSFGCHFFESRYYAQKFIEERLIYEDLDFNGRRFFIERVGDEFIIYIGKAY